MQPSNNPLRQYFRQPAIYLQLPSQGQFWPAESLDLPPNNELPVYPMTAVDEITSRTPDALFNGSATVRIVESCVPAVKDAWEMPSIDVDALLISTRIATYGHTMDINTVCPNCQNLQEYGVDLRTVLEQCRSPDYATPLAVGDLIFYFKPISYRQMNELNQVQFQDQKLISLIDNTDMPEDQKMAELGKALVNITKMTVTGISQTIDSIRTPTAIVSEPEYILEFMQNIDREMFAAVRDYAIQLRQSAEVKPLHIKCSECSHEYEQAFVLDMSNFFGTSS